MTRLTVHFTLFVLFCAQIGAAAETCNVSTGSIALDLLKRPAEYKDDDSFYRDYFTASDLRVRREYIDRWKYHDTQINYAGTYRPVEHLSIGSTDTFGHGPLEWDVRKQFAEQVLRIRMDSALRTYFAPKERAAGIKSAQKALDKVKNVSTKMSSDPGGGEIRFGYDVFSDFSKLEYVQNNLSAGFYHEHLLSALAGAQGKADALSLRVSANPGLGLPSGSLRYAMNGSAVEMGLAKPLSAVVSTEIVSKHPVHDQTIPHSYEARVYYRF